MSRTVPLLIQLSYADPRPVVRQITDGIRRQIVAGELPVGVQLPSVRGLAQQLAINPKTVAKAYGELANEGWLDARQGTGLFIAAPRQTLSTAERERRLAIAIDAFTDSVIGLGYPLEDVLERAEAALQPCLKRRRA